MKAAGIDVSHKTVTVALNRDGRIGTPREFKNTAQGHLTLIRALRQAQVNRIGLEATGLYHLDLALALDDAGFELMVINPKAAKRFAEALQTRTKTDAVDAAVLAEFAQRMPFTPWQHPQALVLSIRAVARRIAALNKLRTQTKNQLHAAQLTATTPDVLIAELQHTIAHLEAQIQRLRQQLLNLIATDQNLHAIFDLLVSVKGIAATTAIQKTERLSRAAVSIPQPKRLPDKSNLCEKGGFLWIRTQTGLALEQSIYTPGKTTM